MNHRGFQEKLIYKELVFGTTIREITKIDDCDEKRIIRRCDGIPFNVCPIFLNYYNPFVSLKSWSAKTHS